MAGTDRTGLGSAGAPLNRRRFLAATVAGVGATLLAACSPAVAPALTNAPAAPASTSASAAPTAARAATQAPGATVAAVAPTAASAATSAPAVTGAAKTFRMVTQGDITTFNPQHTTYWPDLYFIDVMYDQLYYRTPDMKLVPGLATESKLVNDKTWQFKLRPNVKFHNGDPLTAADVKFTVERTYDPAAKTTVSTIFSTVERIEVVDDLTVNFMMKAPDPLLPAKSAAWGGPILPAKYFQQVGAEGFNAKPIGTGPYKFVEWVKGDHLTMQANKEYWGGSPAADTVTMRPSAEDAPRLAALLSGEADYVDYVTPDQVDRVNSSPNTKVVSVPYAGYMAMVLNPAVKPLDNKIIRQALSFAVDRQTLVKDLRRGQALVANGSIPKGDFGYNPDRPPLAFDLNKAKALLQQGGYSGEEINLMTHKVFQTQTEAVAAMWNAAGVKTKIEVVDPTVRAEQFTKKSLKGAAFYQPGSAYGDPDGLIFRHLAPGGYVNYWNDDEYIKLGNEAKTSTDEALRKKDYERMQEILLDAMPWIPMYSDNLLYGLAKPIKWQPNPIGRLELRKEVFALS